MGETVQVEEVGESLVLGSVGAVRLVAEITGNGVGQTQACLGFSTFQLWELESQLL